MQKTYFKIAPNFWKACGLNVYLPLKQKELQMFLDLFDHRACGFENPQVYNFGTHF